ncbi:MAG: Gfo/Idh/MocA family oxidoreductase [Clostridiales bacterium]|jgi:predicted dehydrogenase|nr:Gfo/Idh/MocA family oxidoreductase [Clostridiales bacterium]
MELSHKLAIIGYGGMGIWHHENVAEKISAIQVKGAYDIREEAREKAADNGLKVYQSPEDLFSDPEIDIVTVATPNNFHKDYIIAGLRAEKAVISEKPVTLNSAELEEIIAVQKETGMLFSIHQNRRWDRDYRIIKKILSSGRVGKPYFIESRVQGSRGSMHGWRGHKINGGGMLLDWGVHLLDQMLRLVDAPVVSVYAHMFSIFTPGVDDNIKLFLRFGNNVSAVLEMATNCFINLPRWHVSCESGTVVINGWDCDGKIVQLKADGEMTWEDDIVYTEAGPTRTMAPRSPGTTAVLPLPDTKTDWTEYYKNIVDVLDNGAELLVKPEQALRVMNIIDLLFESEETGKSISCEI